MSVGMFKDLGRVLEQVSKDRSIPKDKLIEAIESAFLTAARKKWGHLGELEAHYNTEMGEIELFQFKEVVDDIEDAEIQMTVDEAHDLDPEAQPGDSLGVKMDPSTFGRIAAQAAKQVIIQKVRDAERGITFEEYRDRVGEIVTGIVRRFERGDIIIDLGRAEGMLPKFEQVQSESYRGGERLQAYFLRIDPESRGPIIILSRKDTRFVIKLFDMEVPEVSEGVVEIRAAAREAGLRTKVAVYSRDSDVDPVGACVGVKGSRVQNIVAELKGEKVDIIAWDQDPAKFVCNAISPAEVVKVIIRDREHSMEVVVPDDQLSLAIGRRGHNVRLAAELTGWNIDVFGETKIEDMARRSRAVLKQVLNLEESMAIVLYSHAYRTFEDIARSLIEVFLELPGLSEDELREIHAKSIESLEQGISTKELVAEIIKEEEAVVQAMMKEAEEVKAKLEEEAAREAQVEDKTEDNSEENAADPSTEEALESAEEISAEVEEVAEEAKAKAKIEEEALESAEEISAEVEEVAEESKEEDLDKPDK